MRRECIFIVAAMWLLTSCDQSPYTIHIKSAHITEINEEGGHGYIVVDKAAADNIAKYGSVYISGKFCPGNECVGVTVGGADKYNQIQAADGMKLRVDFDGLGMPYERPPFWLKNIACLKVETVQGYVGREGQSDWFCDVKIEG